MPEPDLVGRAADLAPLRAMIDDVERRGSALLVLGEPGIGKTALVAAAAAHARSAGYRVLATTGVQSETHLPFAGLHQLLRPLLPDLGDLAPAQRDALRTAFGEGVGPAPEPFLVALATLNLLTDAAARRPLVLVVDDVQWLDRPSHDAVAFVARRLDRDPIVLMTALRSGHDLPIRAIGLPEHTLTGLDDAAGDLLLARHSAQLEPEIRARIRREAMGNPLALVELPAAWRPGAAASDELPLSARLERAFADRIAEFDATCRDVLLVAAVDDEDDLGEILEAAALLARSPVGVDHLQSALSTGLFRLDGRCVRFRHPLVRSGILQAESTARRHAAHAALAEVLRDQPYRRAVHRARAIVGVNDEVADELEATRDVALRRGSVRAAIWALERAAELTTDSARRGRRRLRAAEHAFGLGRADLVDRLLSLAARDDLSDLDQARMEWLREVFHDGVPGDAARVAHLCRTADRAGAAGDVDLALNLLLGAALRCWWADTGPGARAGVAAAADGLTGGHDDPRLLAVLAIAEPVERAREVRTRLAAVVLESIDDADTLRLYGMAAHCLGDPVHAVDFLGRAESRLREQGRVALLGHVLTMQIIDCLEIGEWARAAACIDEAQRIAHDTGQAIWDAGTAALSAMTYALRGEPGRVDGVLAGAEQAARARRLTNLMACVHLARGYARLAEGRPSEAFDALRPLFDPAGEAHHLTERFHGLAYLAEAAVRCDRRAAAREVLHDLEREGVRAPAPTLHVHLAYARAVLAEDGAAEALYRAALATDLTRWPWHRARLELAFGSWLRRQRRVGDSRTPLRAALATFDALGAPYWADLARRELRAAGERIEGQDVTARELLTAQELQIALLAADGLSNREIGARLFLSPRTVGSHLYRLFPKLEITSRTQLAKRLELH